MSGLRRGDTEERPLHRLGGPPIRPDGHHRPGPQRQGVRHRRPLRRDQGAACRLLPGRGEGPERGHSTGRQDPPGPVWQHRSTACPPDPGNGRPGRSLPAGPQGVDVRRVHMRYVDGYVLPVPRKKLQAYRRLARKAGKIWREHGALEFRECVGEDLTVKMGAPFPRRIKLKPGETVMFSWVGFKSRAHRDRVNARVMKDPRLATMCDPKNMPFDVKRMSYGGFKILVEALGA